MQIRVYAELADIHFNSPNSIVLFNTQENYAFKYLNYIQPALRWIVEGSTYNINNQLVCEIQAVPHKADISKIIYISIDDLLGAPHFYFVTNYEYAGQKIRFYLLEDTFATYYGRAKYNNLIVKRSTQKLDTNRIIKIPEESQEIPRYRLARNIAQAYTPNNLAFLLKIKYQSSSSANKQAYAVNLWYVNISDATGNTAISRLKKMYSNICNSFEIKQSGNGQYYPMEIEEIYLLPNRYINPNITDGLTFYLHYVDVNEGFQDLEIHYVEKFIDPINLNLSSTSAAYSKLIIGNNEIDLPKIFSWGGSAVKGEISFTYNVSDFDIILNVENNEPLSIKDYFKCEVANSTQETSLQKMARQASFIMNLGATAVGGALSIATGGAYGAAVGFGALAGTVQQAGQQIIDDKTKSQLPATHFTSTGFSVFLNNSGEFRQGFIFHEFYAGNEISQGALDILHNGVTWYDLVKSLETLLTLPPIFFTGSPEPGARNYVEGEIKITGLPTAEAAAIEALILGGVEIINGES